MVVVRASSSAAPDALTAVGMGAAVPNTTATALAAVVA